jgi:NurA-like 5'-3' nuclease
MEAITVALITVVGAVLVALVEKGRRENKSDHGVVSEKLDIIGKSLGRSIDRVEDTVVRNEVKLDQHIADHARGNL